MCHKASLILLAIKGIIGATMKKSRVFIYILALMFTLLMAVACDSAPSILESTTDNNGCVPAYLNVLSADSRGIEVSGLDTAITYYRVALIPEWSTLDSGAPIYGQIGTRTAEGGVEYGEKTFASQSSIELGYVTPGKWTVYVSAYNKDKKMIMEGFSSSFINYSSSNINISLLPATRGGRGFLIVRGIYVQRLSDDHANRYRLRYILSQNGEKKYSGDLYGYTRDGIMYTYCSYQEISGQYVYEVDPGQYILTLSLEEKDQKGAFNSIGGITKVINIAPGQTTHVDGTLQPSEFKRVGIDFTFPQVSVSMSDVDSKQEKDNSIIFQCTDNSKVDLNVFNRVYYWFVDGEMITGKGDYIDGKCTVTDLGSNGSNISSLECKFSSYGRREIKCEVVYIPIASTDVPLRYVGSGMKEVEIIPGPID